MAYNRFALEQDVQAALDPIGELDLGTALREALEMRVWMKEAADGILAAQIKRGFEQGRTAEKIAAEIGWHPVSVYNFLVKWRKRSGDAWYNPRWTGDPHRSASPSE